jgi:hypothetical protein
MQHELNELEEKKRYLNEALAHKEYSEEYHFEFKHALTSKDFKHTANRELVEVCNAAHVHMHPDLVAQLIETELFERMKGHVLTAVKGKSVTYLMDMKNDLERMMLNDQAKSIASKQAKLDEEMKAFEEMVKNYTPPVETEKFSVEYEASPANVGTVKSAKKKK